MSDCRFCNGNVIKAGSMNGYPTMEMALNRFMNVFSIEFCFGQEKDETLSLGIQLQHGNRLCWDSSSREYATLDVEIQYCPFCGKELHREQD